jgi:hypothetical protein
VKLSSLLSKRFSLVPLGVTLAVSFASIASASAATFTETTDAGDMTGTAVVISGAANTSLTAIKGTLTSLNGITEGDMYEIHISAPTLFSASTTGFVPGANNFDSQLFLFTLGGIGILANDDDPVSGGAQSNIPAGSFTLAAGDYELLITGSGKFPGSAGGAIFPNFTDGVTDPTGVYGPTGPGGGSKLTTYVGSSNEGGAYSIALTGAQFVSAAVTTTVPEPSSIAILAAGIPMLVLARRRRAARAS